ncbi:hypothetical protein F7642_06240 [Tenacibaculum finnmarkense genomovar ulcerans]|uniref:hypothetical protein n=1 Tax=Tenacibaculum finnmarkense TaxID=2781243 RepID=UPI00187B444F|nr:hypothetical protein [Tenacibaculum finnmarkense]MBE7633935.1 hypothetical protein [Tenacibaculum finnmarkense genomovar ulcerans]MCD8430072.1 hypothetical protein [Tenacibaculum finnmarkense genomovar ulcerans]MCG8795554.1 hypothetical protein [Tenacibaculum finnmarkense]MCG8797667.1 hypothetical protein [Tenacibaculum finnmarkense]
MEYFTLARVIHVICVVLWIGGVSMVTTVIIPAVKGMNSKEDQIKTFEQIEGRFAIQAKITTVLTGLSGFYMLYVLDGWDRYFDYQYWWIHAMTLVWVLFTLVLYVLEPFILHKLFKKYAEENPSKTFSFIHKAHWFLLILSLITTAGAVAGSHGWFFIK